MKIKREKDIRIKKEDMMIKREGDMSIKKEILG